MAADSAFSAASMPIFICIGLAPAATFLRPSVTIAWASTVAVVVPSPATSSVLVAASLSSCAPMFSNGSASSMSRATVTPSWVTVGAPYFLSRATLRPLGPSVVPTASASASMPRFRARSGLLVVGDELGHSCLPVDALVGACASRRMTAPASGLCRAGHPPASRSRPRGWLALSGIE